MARFYEICSLRPGLDDDVEIQATGQSGLYPDGHGEKYVYMVASHFTTDDLQPDIRHFSSANFLNFKCLLNNIFSKKLEKNAKNVKY